MFFMKNNFLTLVDHFSKTYGILMLYYYTPGIYADGYIVSLFRSSVRMFVGWLVGWLVGSFVSSFVIPERSWNLCQSFC